MEKISELMDGELDAHASRSQIRRLEDDATLAAGWETYHLIRDALRNEMDLSPQFCRRLHERLASEPPILAPHAGLSARMVRYTLPIAAGVAGVAVVGWLALANTPSTPGAAPAPAAPTLAQAPVGPKPRVPAQAPAGAPVDSKVRDYLLAHQEFSPSTAMQGVASYVRTVSTDDTPGQ
jgi:sigma-E factor negative regulatory protein RseA